MPRKHPAVLGMALVLLTSAAIHAQTPPGEGKPGEMNPAAPEHPALQRSGSPQANPIEELEKSIAGREKEPSGTVFKNVQILKQVPAGQLLDIMRMGFSRSLGVRCSKCHIMGQWEKDDKDDKQVARDMMKMTSTINNDLLKNIKNLMSDKPEVTCATCHRGQEKPATTMEGAPGGPRPTPPAKPSGR
jgi:hypothetical protein